MKKSLLLILLSGISLIAWVQNDAAKQATTGANANAYAKGNWRMPLMQNLRFGFYSTEFNDVKYSKESNLDLNLQADYFVADGWAIGAGLNFSLGKTELENVDVESKETDWEADVSVLYGMPIKGNELYWNVRLGFGFGGEKDKDKTPSNTTEDKLNYIKYGLTTGLDIRNGNSNVFINPWIGYDIKNINYENDDEEDLNRFSFGVRLVSSMACREYTCDHKTNCNLSRNMYNQGRSFIGYTTKGMFSFGSSEFTEANNAGSDEVKQNAGHIRFDYNYFIINNVALGAMGMFQYAKDKGDDVDFEFSSRSFSIGPKVTAHLPVENCWRNFFGEVGVAFGSSKVESKSGTFSSEQEESLTNFWGGVGYNFVVSPNLSFTPIADYVSRKSKDKDTDGEAKTTGVNVRFGLRYIF
jgi:hypothetical protein